MITIDQLRLLLDYDVHTGELRWRERPREMFKRERLWMTWNTRYAGQIALSTIDSHGYAHGRLMNKKVYAHRIIMALVNGEWPDEVDHIDGNAGNNALANLRATSHKENMRNVKRGSSNTSGSTGVYWNARDQIWVAQITVSGRTKILGRFADKVEAAAARKDADRKYGFHENHGRAA